MFRILEIVREKNEDLLDRYLPLQFPTQVQARAHVEMLQAQFLIKGYDEEGPYWWARNDDAGELYRWVIESETAIPPSN